MRRPFVSSIPILALAYGASAAANLLLTIVVGRTLGAAALGTFALAIAVARVFYAATDLGVAPHMTRLVARTPGDASNVFSLFVALRFWLIPAALLVAASAAFGFERDEWQLFCVVGAALGLVTVQAVYEALLLSLDKSGVAAVLTLVSSVAVAGGTVAWGLSHGTLVGLGAVYLAACAVSVAVWAAWCWRRLGIKPRLALQPTKLRAEIARSWPIGISVLLGIGALRLPILMLGARESAADVGAFSAVDTVVTAASILQVAITNATFPKLAASHRTDPAAFRRLFIQSNAMLASIGIVIALGMATVGEHVLTFIFTGKDFAVMTKLLPIVAWSVPCLLLVHHNIYVFAASDRERTNVRLMTVWLGLIAAFQIVLLPVAGVVGSAWGVLGARFTGLLVVGYVVVRHNVHRGETYA